MATRVVDVLFFFASFLFANNLKVGIMAMALGVLGGAFTILLILYNGMLLGAFVAIHHRGGILHRALGLGPAARNHRARSHRSLRGNRAAVWCGPSSALACCRGPRA